MFTCCQTVLIVHEIFYNMETCIKHLRSEIWKKQKQQTMTCMVTDVAT